MNLPPLAPERAREIVATLAGTRILVIGDVMLDKFTVGRVSRISPEAPVPVLTFSHETTRLGGAANVANNIVALGGKAILLSVIGADDAGTALTRACKQAEIATRFVTDPTRPTTTKMRIVTERNQQVARVDYEHDGDISTDVARQLEGEMRHCAATIAGVVVSDYLKGVVTRDVMNGVTSIAAAHRRTVLVDPKIPHIDLYECTDVITPNHYEAETATHMRIRSLDEARAAAHAFRARTGCKNVLMTRGDQGMWLLGDGVEGALPAAAREVADVTGAGDTVMAAMALVLASAAGTMVEAAQVANAAAGVAVGKFGAATVTPAELLAALESASEAT
jgi:D-beta-D-heptose 7-phosphate kinase/D-beta-D-heptose 1-phosphate adenosyltransferase